VGYHAAKFLQEEDSCLITGIIERDGALTNDDGIDVEAVRANIMATGGAKDLMARYMSKTDQLSLKRPVIS
jgi:glutamate dehydrogenase (NAD(P)+)